jgi:ABC-type glycerol-3-phosphate transport system substrate-binding protein
MLSSVERELVGSCLLLVTSLARKNTKSAYRHCAALTIIIGACAIGISSAEPAQESSASATIEIEIGMLSAGGNTVGRMFEGADPLFGGDWIRREIESFSRAHPEITIRTVAIEKPSRFAHPIESTPDLARNIVGIDSWTGYDTAYLAQNELIRPIEHFLPDPEFDGDAFYSNAWGPVTYAGRRWGVPWTNDAIVLACNWPLFEAAGIEAPPKTWVEFLETAKKLTRDTNGDGGPDQWGFRESDVMILPYIWATMVAQTGEPFVTAEGMNTLHSANRDAFEFIRRMKSLGVVKTDELGTDSSEYCGMQILSGNQVHAIMHRRHLRLAPLPTDGLQVYPSFGRMYLAIRRASPEEERASWEFVKWISRRDVSMPRALGRIPARRDFVERGDFQARAAQGPMDLRVLYDVGGRSVDFGPQFQGRFSAFLAWYGVVSETIKGKLSFDEAVVLVKQRTASQVISMEPKQSSFEIYQ